MSKILYYKVYKVYYIIRVKILYILDLRLWIKSVKHMRDILKFLINNVKHDY